MDYENILTKGALRSIKNNEIVENLVLQVIDVHKISRITVSDGENINSVEIAINLNSVLSIGNLAKFSIIRINNYVTTNFIEPAKEPRQVIIVLDLVVIVRGYAIRKTIGNPQPISNNIEPILRTEASGSTVQVYYEACSELLTKQELWRSLIERRKYSRLLTIGALQSIMDNEEVKYPVMQVLSIRKLINTVSGNCGYRLTISDGQYFHTLVMLANQLHNMITNGYLTEFSIIYIKRYAVGIVKERSNRNRKVIILKDLDFLIACPGIIFGDPKPAKENSDQIVENNIPTSTDAIPEPSVEMDTSPLISPIAQDQEVENLLLNLDMLHIF